MKELRQFLKHVRFGYLLFTSLIIVGLVFGASEIMEQTLFSNISINQLRWFHFSRGIVSSLMLMTWAAWTVYQYRRMYEERLHQREVQYGDIIESSADAIFFIDNNNFITSWNHGAELIFGWEKEEIMGLPLETLVPDDLLELKELACLAYGIKEKGYVANYETERLAKDGRRILVSLTETAVKDENGRMIGRSKILRDLTELRKREEQFQRSERLATVGHMAAGVAHEVGNPLAAISSLVQLTQRKTDDPFIQEQLKKVRDHIGRITKIVRDLVDFSRPSSMERTKAQINNIVESAIGLLRHDARCRDCDFHTELEVALPEVECVPDHIHQVLVNLLLNAVDASEGQVEARIDIITRQSEENVQILVRDYGIGMSEEVQNRIFEPFFTTKEVGSGTGLGLSVSHGIIKKMNGDIKVDSKQGEGTTFTIELPLTKEKEVV